MANTLLLKNVLQHGVKGQNRAISNIAKIGSREIVGHGFNGQPCYFDRWDFPMPAIRYKPCTPEIQALREKERGDWKKLTIDEKKQLYRASFRQTFSEIYAPSGEWKHALGIALLGCSLGIWTYMFFKNNVYDDPPESLSEESKRAQLKRMLQLDINPVTGISAQYKK